MGNTDRRFSFPDDETALKLRDRSWMEDEVAPIDFAAFGRRIGQIISQSVQGSRKGKDQA
jgi:hypothetical protein